MTVRTVRLPKDQGEAYSVHVDDVRIGYIYQTAWDRVLPWRFMFELGGGDFGPAPTREAATETVLSRFRETIPQVPPDVVR
jgi:hypothetical protein